MHSCMQVLGTGASTVGTTWSSVELFHLQHEIQLCNYRQEADIMTKPFAKPQFESLEKATLRMVIRVQQNVRGSVGNGPTNTAQVPLTQVFKRWRICQSHIKGI